MRPENEKMNVAKFESHLIALLAWGSEMTPTERAAALLLAELLVKAEQAKWAQDLTGMMMGKAVETVASLTSESTRKKIGNFLRGTK